MRIIVDLTTSGPVTPAIVTENVRAAILGWMSNEGLSAEDDEGSVISVTVSVDEDATVPKKRLRIRCVQDKLNNVSYLHQNDRGTWICTLDNGMGAAFSYAGIHGDQTAVRFALEDAQTIDQALAIVRRLGAGNWTYQAA